MSPARVLHRLSTEEERQRAKPVYRAIRDAGSAGILMDELVRVSGSFNLGEVLGAIVWMRSTGLGIVVTPGAPGEHGRAALRSALPDSWDGTL